MPVLRVEVKSEGIVPETVQKVANAIRAGQLVALPTETVYGIAALPDASGTARLTALKRRKPAHPFTRHLASVDHLERLVPAPAERVQRLLRHVWPGPLTIVLQSRERGTIGLRVPDHPFTLRVLEQFEDGLLLSSANRTGEPPLSTPDDIAAGLPEIDILCDDGPPALGEPSTVVTFEGERLVVLRSGALSEERVREAAAHCTLYVCTGNTCRSPLAEALGRQLTATALGIAETDLLESGHRFLSAGTAAGFGGPASTLSVQAGAEIGLDLSAHRARDLRDVPFGEVDVVYCLSCSHLHVVLDHAPELAKATHLLDPAGCDIPDPFGGDSTAYREARDAIAAAVRARLAV